MAINIHYGASQSASGSTASITLSYNNITGSSQSPGGVGMGAYYETTVKGPDGPVTVDHYTQMGNSHIGTTGNMYVANGSTISTKQPIVLNYTLPYSNLTTNGSGTAPIYWIVRLYRNDGTLLYTSSAITVNSTNFQITNFDNGNATGVYYLTFQPQWTTDPGTAPGINNANTTANGTLVASGQSVSSNNSNGSVVSVVSTGASTMAPTSASTQVAFSITSVSVASDANGSSQCNYEVIDPTGALIKNGVLTGNTNISYYSSSAVAGVYVLKYYTSIASSNLSGNSSYTDTFGAAPSWYQIDISVYTESPSDTISTPGSTPNQSLTAKNNLSNSSSFSGANSGQLTRVVVPGDTMSSVSTTTSQSLIAKTQSSDTVDAGINSPNAFDVPDFAYSDAVLVDGPVAYYHLSENAGNLALNWAPTGRQYDLIIGGGVTLGAAGLATTHDTAMTFNSPSIGNGVVSPPASNTLFNSIVNTITVECLLKVSSLPAARANIITYGDDNNATAGAYACWSIRLTSTGQFTVNVQTVNGDNNFTSRATATVGAIYHLALTYDGSTIKFYINGALDSNLSASGVITTYTISNFGFGIGCPLDSISGVSGIAAIIDEVAIYNKSLSASRIQTHYNLINVMNATASDAPAALTSSVTQLPSWGVNKADNVATPVANTQGNSVPGFAYLTAVMADNPTALYHLGEIGPYAFNWASVGGRTIDGLVGSGIVRQVPGLASPVDGAVQFNGTVGSNYQIVVNSDSSYIKPGSLSVEFLIKIPQSGIPATTTILSCGMSTAGSGGYSVKYNANGTLTFNANGAVTSASALLPGEVSHVVCTYDATTGNSLIYLDGVLNASATHTAQALTGLYTAGVGLVMGESLTSSTQNVMGTLDEVAIYGQVLTSTRVAAHYAAVISDQTYVATQSDTFSVNSATATQILKNFYPAQGFTFVAVSSQSAYVSAPRADAFVFQETKLLNVQATSSKTDIVNSPSATPAQHQQVVITSTDRPVTLSESKTSGIVSSVTPSDVAAGMSSFEVEWQNTGANPRDRISTFQDYEQIAAQQSHGASDHVVNQADNAIPNVVQTTSKSDSSTFGSGQAQSVSAVSHPTDTSQTATVAQPTLGLRATTSPNDTVATPVNSASGSRLVFQVISDVIAALASNVGPFLIWRNRPTNSLNFTDSETATYIPYYRKVTQVAVEVLVPRVPHPRHITQVTTEVIGNNSPTNAAVSQFAVEALVSNKLICYQVPRLGTLQLINDGDQPFATEVGSNFLVIYASNSAPKDGVGNISADGFSWTPPASGTASTSHFMMIQKDYTNDCIFYPVAGTFNDRLALAWLEDQPTGRLNLKYSDVPVNYAPGAQPPTIQPPSNFAAPTTFYFYPQVQYIQSHEQTSSIPMSDITVVGTDESTFTIDLKQAMKKGIEVTMTTPIAKIRFTQTFREPTNVVQGQLTSLYTSVSQTAAPLPNVGISIYAGKTNRNLYQRVYTNAQGIFNVTLQNLEYLFEIDVNNLNFTINMNLL